MHESNPTMLNKSTINELDKYCMYIAQRRSL